MDSLVGMRLVERLERDLGDLPTTVRAQHVDEHLSADPGRLAAVLPTPTVHGRPVAAVSRSEDRTEDGTEDGPRADDIAVVAVAGRYPGSSDLDAFWQNLADGRDCVTEVPADRWDWRTHFDPRRGTPQRTYGKWGGFLDDVDQFDAELFGVLPRDAVNMDPQERLFLQTCWRLLEQAGRLGEHTRQPDTRVFVGVMYGTYGQLGATRRCPT